MGTNRDNNTDKWAALAKQLFDDQTPDNTQPEPIDWEAEELHQIRETARRIDLHFKQKRFSADLDYPAVEAIMHGGAKPGVFRIKRVWTRVAAIVALVLLVGSVVIWTNQGDRLNAREELAATNDFGLTRIELADGSIVTLNVGSHLSYPDQFEGNFREVELEGEAFFEVHPNPEKPFIIRAGRAHIQVLGTSFNVNAIPGSKDIAVVVETGRVQVSANDTETREQDVVLTPGERGVLTKDAQAFTKEPNKDQNFLAWKTHSFVFDKTSLEDVIEQLNKVYRVQIAMADPTMEQLLLTARFDDRPIRFILEVIAMTHNLEVDQIDESGYLLKKK